MTTAPCGPDWQRGTNPLAKERNMRFAGPENLARLESNLWRNQEALQYLLGSGLAEATIRKFHLGLREPYERKQDGLIVRNVLCYPLLSSRGEALGRYGCCAMLGLTKNAPSPASWGRGESRTYYSAPIEGKTMLLVADDCFELWTLDQHLKGTSLENEVSIIAPSHGPGIPTEWKAQDFWSRWLAVYLLQGNDQEREHAARELARHCGRDVFRARMPEASGQRWVDFFLSGGTSGQLTELIRSAPVLSSPAPTSTDLPDQPGEYAANPVNINGAYVNGHLYYPFTIERLEMEETGMKGGKRARRLVASYVTKVVRSDGIVLDIIRLASPRGTPRERQVLALTDGTRIEKEPQQSYYSTWQLDGIQAFIQAAQERRRASHRPLTDLLSAVSAHLRRSVWLPYEDDYAVLALYVALSYVYQVFDAIPLIMVVGEKGTGKSELGDAIASVSCNATVIGQGSAAGVVRLMNETRGLVVLDDLEVIGRAFKAASFGDINQMLKLSYKQRTGRKAITDKNGKTTVFDFYGPKVINNTRGCDPVLGSRMFHIRMRCVPTALRLDNQFTGSDAEELINLRNELHVWGMAQARPLHERYVRLANNKSDRENEIRAPLRAIAELSGDEKILASLELALAQQTTLGARLESPADLLMMAINNCIKEGGVGRLSAAQINLEVRLLGDEHLGQNTDLPAAKWRSPEWVGRQLRALQIRDPRLMKVTRLRLYGHITRVYELNPLYVEAVLRGCAADKEWPPSSPLDFCERATCPQCRYDKVCASTIIGLKISKRLNRGRSGQRQPA